MTNKPPKVNEMESERGFACKEKNHFGAMKNKKVTTVLKGWKVSSQRSTLWDITLLQDSLKTRGTLCH